MFIWACAVRAKQGLKRKREAMEAAPPLLPPLALTQEPPRAAQGMLERLDHLKCAVCLEFMVAAHAVVPCGARLPALANCTLVALHARVSARRASGVLKIACCRSCGCTRQMR